MDQKFIYELMDIILYRGKSFSLNIPHLAIQRGVATGLIGPNGSGKSTLLKILSFLETGYKGMIRFNGSVVSRNILPVDQNVTMLLQHPYLLKRTVYENVAFPLKLRRARRHIRKQVFDTLTLVGLSPDSYANRRWNQLSGGEAQRVSLASRLIMKPKVLILDEPTSSIDGHSTLIIKKAIEKIRIRNMMDLIISSHDTVWLNSICSEVLHIYNGHVLARGPGNILHGPWEPDSTGLWKKKLADGQNIYTLPAPEKNAIGIIDATNVMLSIRRPEDISAQNILHGSIIHMAVEKDPERVRVEIDISGLVFQCSVTHHAAAKLKLLPGKKIWVIFKASSVEWH